MVIRVRGGALGEAGGGGWEKRGETRGDVQLMAGSRLDKLRQLGSCAALSYTKAILCTKCIVAGGCIIT